MRLLVNLVNVTATGPRMVAREVLPVLYNRLGRNLLILVREGETETYGMPADQVIAWRSRFKGRLQRAFEVLQSWSWVMEEHSITRILTFCDIGPIFARVPHTIFIQSPQYVYPDVAVGGVATRIVRFFERKLFGMQMARATRIMVQTPVMLARLNALYPLSLTRSVVVQSAVTDTARRVYAESRDTSRARKDTFDVVVLASYYPNKNHARVVEAAQLLEASGEDGLRIRFTIDEARSPESLVRGLRESSMIENLGHLAPDEVTGVLLASDCLLLPTLMETLGLIYDEAMAAGLTIVTSYRDFTLCACGPGAIYCEPTRPESIAAALVKARDAYLARPSDSIEHCPLILERLHRTWEDVALEFLDNLW